MWQPKKTYLLVEVVAFRREIARCAHDGRYLLLLNIGAARAVLRRRAKRQNLIEVRRLIVDEAEGVACHAAHCKTREEAEGGAHHLVVPRSSNSSGGLAPQLRSKRGQNTWRR